VVRKGLVWRPGGVKLGHGEVSDPLAVQQCRCVSHGHFLDYPSFLVPRKHYAAEVVDGALFARAQEKTIEEICNERGLADTCVVRRWVHEVNVKVAGRLRDAEQSAFAWLSELQAAFQEATAWGVSSFVRTWRFLEEHQRASADLRRRFPTVSHLALSI
jgi:hypothetical protein